MGDRAVIDAPHRAGERALPPLGGVQLGAQPCHRRCVAAGGGQLAPQVGGLVLRCLQRVAHALQLGAKSRRQVARFDHQAVGAGLQRLQLVGATAPVELHPREPGADDEQQQDQDFRRATQLRRLARDFGRDANAGALAQRREFRGRQRCGPDDFTRRRHAVRKPFSRSHRGRLGLRLDDVKLERRPVGAEADDVAVLKRGVAVDLFTVDERAVAAAQVLKHEAVGLAHDRRVPGRHVQIALGVKAHVGQRMTAQADVALAEGLDLTRSGAGKKRELGLHGFRVRYQTRAATTARTARTNVLVCLRAFFSLFGTGGWLPL